MTMGAEYFESHHPAVNQETGQAITSDKAFEACVAQAAYDHGHSGYTGTIAEKYDFVYIGTVDSLEEFRVKAAVYEFHIPENGSWPEYVDDKWGLANLVRIEDPDDPHWVFFGWASA